MKILTSSLFMCSFAPQVCIATLQSRFEKQVEEGNLLREENAHLQERVSIPAPQIPAFPSKSSPSLCLSLSLSLSLSLLSLSLSLCLSLSLSLSLSVSLSLSLSLSLCSSGHIMSMPFSSQVTNNQLVSVSFLTSGCTALFGFARRRTSGSGQRRVVGTRADGETET